MYVSIILAMLLILNSSALGFSFEEQHLSENDRLIIVYEGDEIVDLVKNLAESRGSEIDILESMQLILWQNWDVGLRKSIARLPGVVSIDVETHMSMEYMPDDPYYSNIYQWGTQKINAEEAWDFTLGSQEIILAVLDTGIDYTHEDLHANMWQDDDNHYGYDFWNDDSDPMDDNRHSYENGVWKENTYIYHGTHVAGIAAAVTDNGIGIAGIAQVKLMAVKVMNESGEGTDATVAQGIDYAVTNGADIICMSLGVDSSTLTLRRAVNYARQNGVLLVAAAGNEGSSGVSYPAAYSSVIAVGAIDRTDSKASFSNYGADLEIMAPGTRIWSTRVGDAYQYLSGTSTAAPFVAGVAGLMLSVNPALTSYDIRQAINETAMDIGAPGWDQSTGWGIVDAHQAVLTVAGPAATIVDYPQAVNPNSTLTISWVASGAGSLAINSTYLRWGYAADQMTNVSGLAFGNTTPHLFEAAGIRSPPQENSVLYLQAVAIIEGVEYTSRVVEIDVRTITSDPLAELIENLKKLITEDIGILNFAMMIAAIIAVATIVATVNGRRKAARRKFVQRATVSSQSYHSAGQNGYGDALSGPPPRAVPSVNVDIVDGAIDPSVIEVEEGTRVVWRNRRWAPPPGISIVSGTIDATGSHPDGLFSSGLMIAPGEYWSAVFNRKGFYPYYLSNIGVNGKVLVRSRYIQQ